MPALAGAIGIVIGLLLGALGGGGSILAVPALVYLLGQEPSSATTATLIIVGVSALIALVPHARAGRVRFVQGLVFGALGVGGAYVGSALATHVAPVVLLRAFALLMIVVGALMLRRSVAASEPAVDADNGSPPVISWRPFRCRCAQAFKVVLTASVVGLLTGFFGVGGGFILVPALVLALGFTMPVAVGTSLLVIAVNSATALTARIGHGVSLDWTLIGVVTGAAILGGLVGGRLATRVPAALLTRAFAVLLILVAVAIGVQTVAA